MVDPISDFLTRIRNAQMAGQTEVVIPYSTLKAQIAEVMKKNRFLGGVAIDESGKFKQLKLTLPEKTLTLTRVSKPGQRIYAGQGDLRKVLNGLGIAVVSTSRGVMTGYEARHQNVGGEVLCEIS